MVVMIAMHIICNVKKHMLSVTVDMHLRNKIFLEKKKYCSIRFDHCKSVYTKMGTIMHYFDGF